MKLIALKNNNIRHANPLIQYDIYEGDIYSSKINNYWYIKRTTNKVEYDEVYSFNELIPLSEWRVKQIDLILDVKE